TPGLSSTSTDSVWVMLIYRLRSSRKHSSGVPLFVVEQRSDTACGLDLIIAGACGHHRPHLGIGADDDLAHRRPAVDGARLADDVCHILATLTAQSDAAQRLGQLDEVRDAAGVGGQTGLAVPLFVEQCLPLTHHADI